MEQNIKFRFKCKSRKFTDIVRYCKKTLEITS